MRTPQKTFQFRTWGIVFACSLAGLIPEVSGSLLNQALGSIVAEFRVPITTGQLIISISKLLLAALVLTGGSLRRCIWPKKIAAHRHHRHGRVCAAMRDGNIVRNIADPAGTGWSIQCARDTTGAGDLDIEPGKSLGIGLVLSKCSICHSVQVTDTTGRSTTMAILFESTGPSWS